MDAPIASLPTLAELRRHVLECVCAHDQLDPEQTPLHQCVIMRSGKPCGLFFQAQDPRLVKTYAVWAGHEGRVLFYRSTGQRFAETRLSDGPDALELLVKPCFRWADSAITRKSQASSTEKPPPAATPLMAGGQDQGRRRPWSRTPPPSAGRGPEAGAGTTA